MEATSTPMSVDQALAMGVSSSWRKRALSRSTGLPAVRARSAATAVDRQMARAALILAFISISERRTSGWSNRREG